jgi:hypothetical protein
VSTNSTYSGYGNAAWKKIRFSRLIVHLVGDNLAIGVEAGWKSSGRYSYRAVDLILSTCISGLVSKHLNKVKISMATTSALGR